MVDASKNTLNAGPFVEAPKHVASRSSRTLEHTEGALPWTSHVKA